MMMSVLFFLESSKQQQPQNNSHHRNPLTSLGMLFFLATVAATILCTPANAQMYEHDRIKQFHARNYTWPIQTYKPDTEGWKKLYDHRFRQIAEIESTGDRYEGYLQSIQSSFLAPNFTEYGFGLARAPEDLMIALRSGIHDGLQNKKYRTEASIQVIEGPERPWFIDRPDLTKRVLKELQQYPETWAGMELTPYRAYGFRLYRNNSQLHMHVDKSQTHIVSFILHIDSSEDAEPWPILIEDYEGRTHEVVLTSGDMLFYESSKCFHGRPKKFNGSWYSSVFVHYYPKYGWKHIDHQTEKHYAVPPEWSEPSQHKFEIPLEMAGTGMKEPSCPNDWCQSQHTIKWPVGGGKEGYWIAPTGKQIPFDPSSFDPTKARRYMHEIDIVDDGSSTGDGKDGSDVECNDIEKDCEWWASWGSNECTRNKNYMHKNCAKTCGVCKDDDGGGDKGTKRIDLSDEL